MNWMNGYWGIKGAGQVYWPGRGLLQRKSGEPKENLYGSKICQVAPLGIQVRLKEPTVEMVENRVEPQVGGRQDDL